MSNDKTDTSTGKFEDFDLRALEKENAIFNSSVENFLNSGKATVNVSTPLHGLYRATTNLTFNYKDCKIVCGPYNFDILSSYVSVYGHYPEDYPKDLAQDCAIHIARNAIAKKPKGFYLFTNKDLEEIDIFKFEGNPKQFMPSPIFSTFEEALEKVISKAQYFIDFGISSSDHNLIKTFQAID